MAQGRIESTNRSRDSTECLFLSEDLCGETSFYSPAKSFSRSPSINLKNQSSVSV